MSAPPWMTKERTALNKRLRDEGRFDAYLEMREGYKAQGMQDKNAWQVAGLAMPPLSPDVPLEFEPTEEARDLFEQLGPLNTPNPSPIVVVNKNFRRTMQRGGNEETEDALKPPAKRRATWESLAKNVESGRVAQPLEIAQWVFLRYMTPIDEITPDEVPDHGAIGLLQHVRGSSQNYTDFVRNIWAKLIPDRRQVEAAARYSDDGRDQLRDLDALEAEFYGEEVA